MRNILLLEGLKKGKIILTISLANLILIMSSYLSIDLGFTPIPITLQTLGIFLVTIGLGKLGFLSLCLYVSEGLMGLPVFAFGKNGIMALLGPTGGYIIGFLVAGFFLSFFAEKVNLSKFYLSLPSMIIANLLIYLFGVIHLNLFFVHNLENSIKLGVIPFLVGDFLKIGVATLFLPILYKIKIIRT